jgi:hypothetical protein
MRPVVSETPQQVSFEQLLELAGPLVKEYFDHEERQQTRELEYDTKALHEEIAWRKLLLMSGGVLALAVFGLAGFLFNAGKDQAAFDLIQLVVAIAGAAFGGYGVARGRQKATDSDD